MTKSIVKPSKFVGSGASKHKTSVVKGLPKREGFPLGGPMRFRYVPVSPDYRHDWIRLRDQPNIDRWRKKNQNIFYHGTTDNNLELIKMYGLIPSQGAGLGATASSAWSGDLDDQLGMVALTDYLPNAATYSLHTSVLAEKGGNQLIIMIDRTRLNQDDIWLRRGSGAPPAKEWDYTNIVQPNQIIGYWHYQNKQWIFYSNPAYTGDEGP
jgi:hypothetical protein